jgi:murein DD-endopeptidase MepM/ murein hydrolase activator NlpD
MIRRASTVLVLVAGTCLGAAWLAPRATLLWRLATASQPASLPVPLRLAGRPSLVDSWGAPRSGGRRHQGIDIFARRGTPVTTPVAGLVLGVGRNRLGGNVVTVLGPALQVHYFAHLDRFGDVAEGDVVRAGDVVGHVGASGNATGGPPHLHYAIYSRGRAINPYPILAKHSAGRDRSPRLRRFQEGTG